VSSRPDGDPRRPLTPEDDWFATPEDWFAPGSEHSDTPKEVTWDDGYEDEPLSAAGPPGLGQRQLTVVLAAIGIVVVIAVAIVVVRSIGGSGNTASPPAATSPTVTTPPTTEPATTAPATTTGTTATTTTPATTTPTTTGTGTGTSTTATIGSVPTGQTLKAGLSGSSVLALQQALVKLGYDPGTPDGTFGPATTQAVLAFQKDNNLPQDGVAGPQTLDAVNAALARG
jgi:murein L,D-transpeptidase YcbB/YkuD